MKRVAVPILCFAICVSPSLSFASARNAAEPTTPFSSTTKSAILESLERDIRRNYVFPDVADRIATALRVWQTSQEYKTTADEKVFAALLTKELQEIGRDKHLGVQYSPTPFSPGEFALHPAPAELERQREAEQHRNFRFQQVERLPGNVGYMDIRGFDDPAMAGPTATAAMQFLANTDALIIDLRHNGGGNPTMVAFLCSYLFGPEPVHLNDLYFRLDNRIRQFWTLSYVPGARMPDKDVYVLTSSRTFSGGEEFAYDLQVLKRATIIGQTTRGGANFGQGFVLNEHMVAFIPVGRAVNPITKTNWRGVGVHPDISVDADKALGTAYVMALEKISSKTVDPQAIDEIHTALATAKERLNP